MSHNGVVSGDDPWRFSDPFDAIEREETLEVTTLRANVERFRDLYRLQQDRTWLEVRDPDERSDELVVARRIRKWERREWRREGRDQVRERARERREGKRKAREARRDVWWKDRVGRRRERAVDPDARLASALRWQMVITGLLAVPALFGMVWTAITVHDNLVGPVGPAIAYTVELMFSVPLIAIVLTQIVIGRFSHKIAGSRRVRKAIFVFEVVLLAATVAINTYGVFTLERFAPPVLVVCCVALQGLVSARFTEIINDAGEEAKRGGGDMLGLLDEADRVRKAIASGAIPVGPDGQPSITTIQRFLERRFPYAKQVHAVVTNRN